jgi:divalent metal cation (Fe/Co/Zn/Cd) transporter
MQDRLALGGAAQRRRLVRAALALQWLTIAWMIGEGAIAIGASFAANSVSLLGFGLDSMAELLSAAVVAHRLNVELRRGAWFDETIERRATLIAGALLFAVAVYVAVASSLALVHRSGEAFTIWGFAVTTIAFVFMLWLGRQKRRLAAELGSAALRADSAEAIACAYLSLTVLLGLSAQYLFGWWWIDAAASFGVLYFLVREGWEAVSGGGCSAE